jgi:hypothetical protein
MKARPAVQTSDAIRAPRPGGLQGSDAEARKAREVLFGQRARHTA